MKIFFPVLLLISFYSIAQTGLTYKSTSFQIPLAGSIDLSKPEPQFDPKLLLIKSSIPSPVTEEKLRKKMLDAKRTDFSKTVYSKTNSSSSQTFAATPVVQTNFNGNTTDGTPNDNDMAISNGGKIVSVTNSNILIFNDTGGTGIGPTSLSFFAYKSLGSLNRTYDPRVIYDPKKDRFIIVFLQGSTHIDTRIILAFSTSNDPQKSWNFYQLPGNITQGDSTWSDYPIVALTDSELFITVNRVKDNTPWQTGFVESFIWQVNKQNGYDSSAILNSKVYHDIKYNGKPIWNICPAKGGATTYGPNIYLVSVRPSDLNNDTVFLHQITNTLASGNASLNLTVLKTDVSYGLMPNALQPGYKKLQTNDARILSACFQDGTLFYAGNTIDSATLNPSVYFGKISGANTSSPTIHGKIIKSDTMDFGYPSIAYVGAGGDDRSVMITHSYVSQSQFPGTAVIYIDRYENISPTVFVKKGSTIINTITTDTVQRWGDYSGIQRKYNETSSCWLSGSFGLNNWNNTWIAKVKNTDIKYTVEEVASQNINSNLFPNPASDYINIDFEVTQTMLANFSISDITGKTMAPLLRDNCKAGTNRFSLRVNDLSPGIYFLNIKFENNVVQSKKFIVGR